MNTKIITGTSISVQNILDFPQHIAINVSNPIRAMAVCLKLQLYVKKKDCIAWDLNL